MNYNEKNNLNNSNNAVDGGASDKRAEVARRKKIVFSIGFNYAIFAFVVLALVLNFSVKNSMGVIEGVGTFRMFTTDSNILCGVAGLIIACYQLLILKGKREKLPKFAVILKFVASVAITVTFLTVLFFLAPTQGFGKMYGGKGVITHLLCPIYTVVSFLLFDCNQWEIKNIFTDCLWGIIPVVLYGVIYVIMVVAVGESNGGWPDFYGFNKGGLWGLVLVLMFVVSYVLSLGVLWLYRFVGGKLKDKTRQGV